jgi:uncharacterized protein YndB with AHSA1/START domain
MNKTTITADHGKQEIIIEREFDSARDLVFRCFVHPELLVQVTGPRDMETTFNYFEAKSGGSYRFVQRDTKGEEFGFHGVFHKVKSPERIIETFEYEDMPGHVSLVTLTFEELPEGRTRLTQQSVFQSVADRDGMLETGMRQGVVDSHLRLDELLERIETEEEKRETRRDHI